VWVFIILFIVLINKAMPSVDAQALKILFGRELPAQHRDLVRQLFLSGYETYLMARDYQELNQWEKALEFFRKVKTDDLIAGGLKEVFFDNYAYYYSQAVYTAILKESTNTNVMDFQIISNLGPNGHEFLRLRHRGTGMYCYQRWTAGDQAFLTNEGFSRGRTRRPGCSGGFPFLPRRQNAAARSLRYEIHQIPSARPERPDQPDRGRRIFLSFDMNQLGNAFLYYLDAGAYSNADVLLKLHFSVFRRTRIFLVP